jgi:cyclopropane-fatty-acyl-phospholipid synthase
MRNKQNRTVSTDNSDTMQTTRSQLAQRTRRLSNDRLATDSAGDHDKRLLTILFVRYPRRFAVRLWDGTTIQVGASAASQAPMPFTLNSRDPAAVATLILGLDPLRFAQAYFDDQIDVEGDFFAALSLKDHIDAMHLSWPEQVASLLSAGRPRFADWVRSHDISPPDYRYRSQVRTHSPGEYKRAVSFHYDVSNSFYAAWLDPAMVYSCAYFDNEASELAPAQQAKLDIICRKLMLASGESLLDIGC